MECIVENAGDSIGYIGLTQNTGRIVIIDQASRFKALRNPAEDSSSDGNGSEPKEKNFFVREQYVLGHSNNVDIICNNNFPGHNLLNKKFFKMITKRQMPSMFEDILFQNDTMRPLAPTKDKSTTNEDLDSEILIIHG